MGCLKSVKYYIPPRSNLQRRHFSYGRHCSKSHAATHVENEPNEHSLQALREGINQSTQKQAILEIRDFLPFHDFSTSVYGVPMLLFLRLFYQAAPFALRKPPAEYTPSSARFTISQSRQLVLKSQQRDRLCATENFLDAYSKMEVTDFLKILRDSPELSSELSIRSITWVKALASPLSHEYLQFLVHDRRDSRIRRLVVERSDMGDIVTVGWDWSTGKYASHHHVLPLPLITLSLKEHHGTTALSLQKFAETLHHISAIRPYRLLREMCWWYAEKVFIEMARQYPSAIIQEWPFASLRYSFVVKTEWIRRPVLVKAAEEFRKMNVQDMKY